MPESMTGSAEITLSPGITPVKIFIKSVNHKFFESSYHLPAPAAVLEKQMEKILRTYIGRGRVDIQIEGSLIVSEPVINHHTYQNYQRLMTELSLSAVLPKNKRKSPRCVPVENGGRGISDVPVSELLKLPGMITVKEVISPEFNAKLFLEGFRKAVIGLKQSRLKEGAAIRKKLVDFLNDINKNKKLTDKRYTAIRKDAGKEMKSEALRILGSDFNQFNDKSWNTAFLEWMDNRSIAEESDRLEMHINLFYEIMDKNINTEDKSRRLDFTVQEMLREVNTIASKSKDTEIRHRIVNMKSSMENMREQIRNLC
jgi:uncharacterized protein (TIGR00255 family)